MIIDFHTHAFPEKIATRAIPELQKKIELQPQTDGTLRNLSEKMSAWGIDKSVICNIATNPRQQTNVNNFALETREKYIDLMVEKIKKQDMSFSENDHKKIKEKKEEIKRKRKEKRKQEKKSQSGI